MKTYKWYRSRKFILHWNNHLFGQFLNMSIYSTLPTKHIYSLYKPDKISRSEDISLLVFKIYKEAVKQSCLDQKNTMFYPAYSLT